MGDRSLAWTKAQTTAENKAFLKTLASEIRFEADAKRILLVHGSPRKMNEYLFEDLRHEYASRLVEKGVPLAQVRDLLGHASITTTERYDSQRLENLQAAAAKLGRGQVFDAASQADHRQPAWRKFQESFKSEGSQRDLGTAEDVPAIEPNELKDLNLKNWLGAWDSN